MKHLNIKDFEITATKNNGINKEWSLCNYYGIERKVHDKTPYNVGSDIELDGMNISVKTPKSSLMSGGFCIGCKTFEGIWRRFRKNTHSDTFAFILNNCDVYFMDINEFSKFIHKFGYIGRESKSHSGSIKIRIYAETKGMVEWFHKNCK